MDSLESALGSATQRAWGWGRAEPTAVEGDVRPPEFDEVFRHHFEFVWRTAAALGSPEIADDVAQDVFLVVRRRLDGFEGGSLRAWLCGITRNVVRNHQRAGARRARHLRSILAPEPPPAMDVQLDLQRKADLFDEFLAGLPQTQREALVLHEIEGMTALEIAELASVPTRTVYSRIRLARAAFERFAQRATTRLRREG